MKILKLIINNVMRIRAVEITPDGNTVMITGKNGAGKSATLQSIAMALCGKDAIPVEPIRRGAKTGSIVLELGGELKVRVTRTFTQGGTKLEVTEAGNPVGSPQTFINRFLGAISLDPGKFLALDPREQRRTLLELLKIDFSDIDAGIAKIKDERAMLNRDKKAVEVNLAAMHFTDDLPEAEISVADLTTELKRRQEHNENVQKRADRVKRMTSFVAEKKNKAEAMRAQISKLMAELQNLDAGIADDEATLTEETQKIGALEDTDEIIQQISASESTNQKIRVNQKYNDLGGKIRAIGDLYYRLGQNINELEASKQKLLADAKMPVEGLTAGDEGLLYKGIPLEQASESEQLRVALAIAMALNPTLRVIRSSANAFDSDSLKIISEMAEANDYQVWLERVDESGKVGIVIEDGMVKE